jgi:hypothetical protein
MNSVDLLPWKPRTFRILRCYRVIQDQKTDQHNSWMHGWREAGKEENLEADKQGKEIKPARSKNKCTPRPISYALLQVLRGNEMRGNHR